MANDAEQLEERALQGIPARAVEDAELDRASKMQVSVSTASKT